MPSYLSNTLIFVSAATAEIAGCFAFWAWVRQGKAILWLAPGLLALIAFAYLLTLAPSDHAGRSYAAYGGVYIAASILWLWMAEGQRPDVWDIVGGTMAVAALVSSSSLRLRVVRRNRGPRFHPHPPPAGRVPVSERSPPDRSASIRTPQATSRRSWLQSFEAARDQRMLHIQHGCHGFPYFVMAG